MMRDFFSAVPARHRRVITLAITVIAVFAAVFILSSFFLRFDLTSELPASLNNKAAH